MTLYHGTTTNRAAKILGSRFKVASGFKGPVVYFAEEMDTALTMAIDRGSAVGAKSVTVIELTMPKSLARRAGLLKREFSGADRGIEPLGTGSGYERILSGGKIIE